MDDTSERVDFSLSSRLTEFQAYLGDTAGWDPDHRNKATINNKASHTFFAFPMPVQVMFTLNVYSLLNMQQFFV